MVFLVAATLSAVPAPVCIALSLTRPVIRGLSIIMPMFIYSAGKCCSHGFRLDFYVKWIIMTWHTVPFFFCVCQFMYSSYCCQRFVTWHKLYISSPFCKRDMLVQSHSGNHLVNKKKVTIHSEAIICDGVIIYTYTCISNSSAKWMYNADKLWM